MHHSSNIGAQYRSMRATPLSYPSTRPHPNATAMRQVSERVLSTDPPVIVKTKQLMAGHTGVLSLAQGVVHWCVGPAGCWMAEVGGWLVGCGFVGC